jgi:hypothetical protein
LLVEQGFRIAVEGFLQFMIRYHRMHAWDSSLRFHRAGNDMSLPQSTVAINDDAAKTTIIILHSLPLPERHGRTMHHEAWSD